MIGANGAFILEKRHLHEGLTEEDFTTYAGYPVELHYIENGSLASEVSLAVRIADEASSIGYLRNVANVRNALSLSWEEKGKERWVVQPVPNRYLKKISSRPRIAIHANAYIGGRREDVSSNEYWANLVCLPIDRITFGGDSAVVKSLIELHELRHLVQIRYKLEDYQQSVVSFHYEVDSDLFAREVIREQAGNLAVANVGHQLRIYSAFRHARHLTQGASHKTIVGIELKEMIRSHGLDAELREEMSPAPFLARAILAKTVSGLGRMFVKQPEYYVSQLILTEPEIAFSALRRCVEDGDFDRSRHAKYVANEILDGVEFFAEGLTRNPGVTQRIFPARQGLGLRLEQ